MIPFDRARCLLVAGLAHRRARRKRAARETLNAAAAEFELLGAMSYAERARSEAGRIGGRPPASLDLTETEDHVAKLAANGGTSRAIAGALFISPRTVEANLARIYRKLGISSRAELGALMALRSTSETQQNNGFVGGGPAPSVTSVTNRLFAVERYDDSGDVPHPNDIFPRLPADVQLARAVYLPADEVVLALVEGEDEKAVAAAVAAAGWRVDRINPAAWVNLPVSAPVSTHSLPLGKALP